MVTVEYNPDKELLDGMLRDASVCDVVIDEALAAISEGDKAGALRLLEIVADARTRRTDRRERPRRRASRREPVEA